MPYHVSIPFAGLNVMWLRLLTHRVVKRLSLCTPALPPASSLAANTPIG
jgi:hypothetical protein